MYVFTADGVALADSVLRRHEWEKTAAAFDSTVTRTGTLS